jgi:hypothetical protein
MIWFRSYYNLPLWLKQLERPFEVDAISLENINTMFEWRVKIECHVMDKECEWLEEEPT